MNKLLNGGLIKKKVSVVEHLFKGPLFYSKILFGVGNDAVNSFCIDISASELMLNFKIFEEMPNVHEWPISKLIQRELDKDRASKISRDYLLSNGYLKYFPPLTAVLIPTGRSNLPTDSFSALTTEEIAELKKYIFQHLGQDVASLVEPKSGVAGGIYDVNAGDESPNGYLIWDEYQVSAVVIDGQHRYKALLEAMSLNKEFNACRLTVNLIDLVPLTKKYAGGPTAIARDLFVSINNTPVEVDEARLILMDDRDVLATFTQVLVDDSEPLFPPAIRPELIDWRCEQGKHDSSIAMSGVLTLRGVIGAAMFENRSVASVDNRSDKKLVQKWLSSLQQWVKPDDEILIKIGANECLQKRFDIACETVNGDVDDEQPFLFSYSAAAASVIKLKFRNLYLAVFREVYSELRPFKQVIGIAASNGAFVKNNDLHSYLRAFSGQRREMDATQPQTKQAVAAYKNQLKTHSENHILLTVMGQKALSKTMFSEYLCTVDLEPKALLDGAKLFVHEFNDAYDRLHISDSFDECFFSTKLLLRRGILTGKSGDLGRVFWRGIILGNNGEIDYGPAAINLLKTIIADVMHHDSREDFVFEERDAIINRHKKLLHNFDKELLDKDALDIAEKIVDGKEIFIGKLLS